MISKAIQIFDLHPTSDAWAIAADWIEDEGGDWVRAESIRDRVYSPFDGQFDGSVDWVFHPPYSGIAALHGETSLKDDRFLVTNEGDTQSLIVYGEEWLLSHKMRHYFI